MAKFKVGDKVRVLDGSNIPDYTGGWIRFMNEYIGKIGEITHINRFMVVKRIGYVVDFHDGHISYTYDERGLELVENKKIVITKRDDSVMARLYSNEKLVKETNVDSTADFDKDAKDAFEELYRPTKFTFSFDEVKHYFDTDMIEKWRDEILSCCSNKPPMVARIYETISYKEFRWNDFRDGKTAIKVSSNRQLEEILEYFYRRYPSPASRPVVMFDLKNFDDDMWSRGVDYYIYALDGHVYIGETKNLYITDVTKTVNANELWVTHAFTHKWESFVIGFTALYFDEDNIDKILYTLNCKGYTWKDGESPIPTEYKPPVKRGYICMRDEHITWCSESQTKMMFEDETSHITAIVRPR